MVLAVISCGIDHRLQNVMLTKYTKCTKNLLDVCMHNW